ncbi:hypothetical protein [Polyangium mundeleinium]|uniref:Tetratricopeptide repeat protein n=1 Tax=Polyangium mundeleinium TaxID=2995306 RepID=A0ABT5EH72_9BACT|nr:hypothetical protein [Polyangium mundeleinium]MDC0740844.1 hypothetical protein [Polyangium mundeleinium]
MVEAWVGLSADTRLFLRISCLFAAERVPIGPLLTLLRGEGWDEDLFEIAYEEARQEGLLVRDGEKLCVPPPIAAFVRRQLSPALPESVIHAHLEGLWSAACAVCDRPTDATAIEAFLDYSLERADWDGLGGEVDAALTAMASTIGRAITRVDRSGRRAQALSWLLRALPDVEAATSECDVTTRDGVELVTKLWHLVAQIGTLYDEIAGDDDGRIVVAVGYIQKAAEAAAKLFDAASVWRETCGVHWATVAQRMGRLGRHEEAKGHYTRAVALLSEFWTMGCIPEQSLPDSRIILVESLVSLGRDDEALDWFDRAADDVRLGRDDWGRRAKLAKTAFGLGEAAFHAEDPSRACIEWLERASVLYEGIDVRTMDGDMDLGQALFMVSVLRMRPILALPAPMPAAVEPCAGLGMEELAVALSWLERFLSFAERASDVPEEMRAVFGAQVLDLSASAHHHAGRPAEALAMFERADATRERLGDAFRISDGREVERWLLRGRCLRALGRMEAAARAFVRGLEQAIDQVHEQRNKWIHWERDDAALEIAQIHAEIEAIREEAGVTEVLRHASISPKKTRATAHMYRAYVAAVSDRPDAAALALEQGEAEEGKAPDDRVFFRVAVAVTHAIALSYARAERVVEACDWAYRIWYAYVGLQASPPSERQRNELLARRADGMTLEAVIDAAAHDVLLRSRRFVVDLLSGALARELEEEARMLGLRGEDEQAEGDEAAEVALVERGR